MALASVAERPRDLDAWPANRPTELVIAERMLAAALHNYHLAATRNLALANFKTWDTLTEMQKAFYLDYGIEAAIQAVWRGR